MRKNLTLTIDEDVLREARKVALDRKTSVNQLVREYLTELAGQAHRRNEAADSLAEIFRTLKVDVGPITWTRDELHER